MHSIFPFCLFSKYDLCVYKADLVFFFFLILFASPSKYKMIFGKTPANQTSSSNFPWLASIATCLQWISLILITLIFVCPSPWEHNSISLFVISPVQQQQQQQPPNFTSSSVTTLPSQSTVMTSNDSTSSTPSSSSSLPNRYPAIQTAVTQSGTTNTKREPIENAPYQINEVLPNSSLPVNITALNTTTTTTSLIQLRIGVLGSCFRTREGHESCTPAKITAIYQYKGLQSAINSTSSINVEEILPDNMTFYATILLFLIVLLLCVCIFTSVHIFLFFRQNKEIQQSMSASQAITTFFQPTSTLHSITTIISKFLTAILALVLVVSSAIQKYKLSNTKNSFNSANPIMNDSMTTLQADTGNAFGFAWISTLFLIIAFWLQRTANRRENALRNARKEIQKSLPQHFKQDSQQQQQQQQTMMMNNLSRSATLPPYTPPPPQQQKEQGYDLKRTGNQSEFDSSSFINGLPSLQKAYESIGRFNAAKSSPPFSTYQNEFGQRQQHGSPLRHMNTIHHSPSSSTRSQQQQPQIDYYEQSNFGNNTFDQADHSYNTEFLADEPTTCDCSYGRNRLDCSYNSISTDDNYSFCNNNNQNRNRRSFQILKRQNSHSTFGHHHHKNPGSHRLGQDFNNNNRSISPAPSYWTSSSAPPGLQSSSSNTILQQEWARQEKERQRLFMAELRAQRAAMHSR